MKPDTDRSIEWASLLETALTMPGNLRNVYSRFYPYSFMNTVLLYHQGARTPVATYKRWTELGRQVQKGERAKEIIRPITVKREDDNGDEVRYTRFKTVRCLFELTQTTGADLPPIETPEWSLDQALESLSIKRKPFQILDGNTQGYSEGRNIAISPVAVHPFKTAIHELGHVVLGHTTPMSIDEYQTHRGIYEFQAEATAFLTLNDLDKLEPESADVSRAYIQGWLRDERPADNHIRQVFTVTNEILKAGRIEQALGAVALAGALEVDA